MHPLQDVQEPSLASSTMVLDVHAFLGACSDEELRHMRLLAHLCAQTYYMGQLTVRATRSACVAMFEVSHRLELRARAAA